MKLLHITDLHLNPLGVVPRGRNGNFHEDTGRELREVGLFIEAVGADAVLLSGDVFNLKAPARYSPPDILHYRDVFMSWGRPIYAIPGNHDLPNSSIGQIGRSPYALLAAATPSMHCLATSGPVEAGPFRVHGIPYLPLEEFQAAARELDGRLDSDPWAVNVVLTHSEVFPDGESMPWVESIGYSRLAGLMPNADVLCLGHIHKSYPLQEVGGAWFSKPYSMGRVVREHIAGEAERHAPMGTVIESEPVRLSYHVFPHRPYRESFVENEVERLAGMELAVPDYFDRLSEADFGFKDPLEMLKRQAMPDVVRAILARHLE